MTVGLIKPNEGKVFLDNHDITEFPVYKRAQFGIGYLPQEASVFRTLSVENNIRAILEMTDTSKEYQKENLNLSSKSSRLRRSDTILATIFPEASAAGRKLQDALRLIRSS